MKWLDGKKTYLVGIGMILVTAGTVLQGQLELADAVMPVLNGLAFIFLRKGISSIS